MTTDEPRVTLEWLKQNLREDPLFPSEALEVLKRVDPMSTHTIATSAESLVEWWLTERELTCYERGREVSDTTNVTLYPDDTGSYEPAERSIELAWKVDLADVRTLLFRYEMHTPNFLQRETLPLLYQGGPTALGYTPEEAAIEIQKGWHVPHGAIEERLREAAIRGELEVFDPQTALPCAPPVQGRFYGRIPTAQLNAWFKLKGTPYHLVGQPSPEEVDAGKQVSVNAESAQAIGLARGDTDAESLSPACAVFRGMKDLKYAEVAIQFAAGDSGGIVLNISARRQTKRVALQEFDLFDRRKAEMNKQGGLLLALAQGHGQRVQNADSNSKRMSRLRVSINRHLGFSGDPFEPYVACRGWVPKFEVFDKRNAAKDRAEREAKRKTDSIDLPEVMAKVERTQAEQHQRVEYDESDQDETDKWLKDHDRSR